MSDTSSTRAESRRFVHGNLKWEYLSRGEGEPTLIMLPGVLGGPETMEKHMAVFSAHFRVLALSLPKFESLDQFAENLDELLARELVAKPVLSGSSFGGLLAQSYLYRRPENVSGIILSDTGLPNRDRGKVSKIARSMARILPFPLARWLFLAKINHLLDYPVPEDKQAQLEARKTQLQEWVRKNLTRNLLLNRLDLAVAFDCGENVDLQAMRTWPGRMLITYTEDDPSRDEGAPMEDVYPRAEVYSFQDGGHLAQLVHFETYADVIKTFVTSC